MRNHNRVHDVNYAYLLITKVRLLFTERMRIIIFFLLIIMLRCMSVFLQSTNLECLMLVLLLVLHEKINKFAYLM